MSYWNRKGENTSNNHINHKNYNFLNRSFPNYLWPLFQNESWCSPFHMKITFYSHANETNFHMKRWAPRLALKKRPKVIRKWPIVIVLKQKSYFPLTHLPSFYRTVCYRAVHQTNHIQSCSLNQPITTLVSITIETVYKLHNLCILPVVT